MHGFDGAPPDAQATYTLDLGSTPQRCRPLPSCTGTAARVKFVLTATDLALVDTDGSFHAIPGVYDVWVGGTGPGAQGVHVDAGAVAPPLHTTLTVV